METALPQGKNIVPSNVPTLNEKLMSIFEVRSNGEHEIKKLAREDLLRSLVEYKLPLRDLKMLLRAPDFLERSRFPAILSRPTSKCFILEIEHIKLVCFREKCLIFNPEENATKSFISELTEQFKTGDTTDYSMRMLDGFMNKGRKDDFEFVILESALDILINKFRKHVRIKKPALEMLLHQIEKDPETHGLKRMLAAKKSLLEFEQRVEQVTKVVQHLLANDEDLAELFLTKPDPTVEQREQIKLILEAYAADLDEIETETKIFNEMIEDTDQFIGAHLDSVRNEIIKMSLFIELGALVMASGAVVSGIFGMNLFNKIEEHNYGFMFVCIGILFMMISFFAGFYHKYSNLQADTSSAHSFVLIKNFFTYLDDIEYHILNMKTLNPKEFRNTVEKITKLKISDKESEYLFNMFDANKDGFIDVEDELGIRRGKNSV